MRRMSEQPRTVRKMIPVARAKTQILQILVLSLFCLFDANCALGATEISGIIDSNTTLTASGSPYIVTASLMVPNGVTLVILEDAVLLFSKDAKLHVEGYLRINGSREHPVALRQKAEKQPWGGIYFYRTATFHIRNCIIEGTGSPALYFSQLNWEHWGKETPRMVENCYITRNSWAIRTYYSRVYIVNNTIAGNDRGIYSEDVFLPVLHHNNIFDNGDYNIKTGMGTERLNATQNWWGTTDPNRIAETIYDFHDDYTLSEVLFVPYLDHFVNNSPGSPPNSCPILSITGPLNHSVISGTVNLSFEAIDPDGDNMTCRINVDGATLTMLSIGSGRMQTPWDTTGFWDGFHTVEVNVTDGEHFVSEQVMVQIDNVNEHKMISQFDAELDQLQNIVDQLNAQVSSLQTATTNLQTELNAQVSSLQTATTNLQTKTASQGRLLNTLDARIKTLTANQTQLLRRYEETSSAISTLQKSLSTLQQLAEDYGFALTANLSRIRSNLTRLQTLITAETSILRGEIDSLLERTTANITSISANQDNLAMNLWASMKQVRVLQESVDTNIRSLQEEIEALNQSIMNMLGLLSEARAETDRTSDRLDQLESTPPWGPILAIVALVAAIAGIIIGARR